MKRSRGVRGPRHLGRHQGRIHEIAWSADGKILASGSAPNTVKLWDLAKRKQIRELNEHGGPVVSLAWSPEGDLLASASTDDTIRLWRPDSGTSLRTLQGHGKSVTSLAWSPDGTKLCFASTDSSIRMWDVESGRMLGVVGHHEDIVYSLAWSASGDLVSGGRDKLIRIWEPKSGASPRTPSGNQHHGTVYSVAWSRRGHLLASGSADKTILIWDAKRLKAKLTLSGHRSVVRSLTFSVDDLLLAAKFDDDTVRLWRCDNWTEVAELEVINDARTIGGLAFHPNRPILAACDDRSHSHTVRVWHLDLQELGIPRTKGEL